MFVYTHFHFMFPHTFCVCLHFFRCLMQQNACLHVCVSQFACVRLYHCEQSLHVLVHLSTCKRLNYLNVSTWISLHLHAFFFFVKAHTKHHWKCISVWVDASLWSADNAKADTVRCGFREGYSRLYITGEYKVSMWAWCLINNGENVLFFLIKAELHNPPFCSLKYLMPGWLSCTLAGLLMGWGYSKALPQDIFTHGMPSCVLC